MKVDKRVGCQLTRINRRAMPDFATVSLHPRSVNSQLTGIDIDDDKSRLCSRQLKSSSESGFPLMRLALVDVSNVDAARHTRNSRNMTFSLELKDMLRGDLEVFADPKQRRTVDEANFRRAQKVPGAIEELRKLCLRPLIEEVDRRIGRIEAIHVSRQTIANGDREDDDDGLCNLIAEVGGVLPAARIKRLLFGGLEDRDRRAGRCTAEAMLSIMLNPFKRVPQAIAESRVFCDEEDQPRRDDEGRVTIYQREYRVRRDQLEAALAEPSVHALNAETILYALSKVDGDEVSLLYHGCTKRTAAVRAKEDQDHKADPASFLLELIGKLKVHPIVRTFRVFSSGVLEDEIADDDAETLAISLAGVLSLNTVQQGGRTARNVAVDPRRFPSTAALVERSRGFLTSQRARLIASSLDVKTATAVEGSILEHVQAVASSSVDGPPRYPKDIIEAAVLSEKPRANVLDVGFDSTFKQLRGEESWMTCVAGERSQRIVDYVMGSPEIARVPLIDVLPLPKGAIKEALDLHVNKGCALIGKLVDVLEPSVVAIITDEALDAVYGFDGNYIEFVGTPFDWGDGRRNCVPQLHPGYHAKMAPLQAEINRLEVLVRIRTLLEIVVEIAGELVVEVDVEIRAARADLAPKIRALESLKNLLRHRDAESHERKSLKSQETIRETFKSHLIAIGSPDSEIREAQIRFLEENAEAEGCANAITRPGFELGSEAWKSWLRACDENADLNCSVQTKASVGVGGYNREQQLMHLDHSRRAKKEYELAERLRPDWSDGHTNTEILEVLLATSLERHSTSRVYYVLCNSCASWTICLRDPFRVTHACLGGSGNQGAGERGAGVDNGFFSRMISSLGELAFLLEQPLTDSDLEPLGARYIFYRDQGPGATGHVFAAVSRPPYERGNERETLLSADMIEAAHTQLKHAYVICAEDLVLRNRFEAEFGVVIEGPIPPRSTPKTEQATICKNYWELLNGRGRLTNKRTSVRPKR